MDRGFVERGLETPRTFPFRLVLTDSTTIQEPGSPGTTWRLHAPWNWAEKRWEGLDLTDQHGGESLTRLPWQRNDVVWSDRNDAKASALAWIVDQQAHVIARFGWNALRWETLEGNPWDVLEAVRTLTDTTPGQWWVQIRPTRQRPPLRLRVVAIRKSPEAAAASRRQARQTARRHGHTVSAKTLDAADYVLIVTTLPETVASATDILDLYRLRWQIECAFKRLKSLLHLDHLRAFDPKLAQTYLLAKVLGALLVDAFQNPEGSFFPYGYPVRADIPRRLALYPTHRE